MSAPRAYRFDRFRLDLARQRVCGEDGETLPVSVTQPSNTFTSAGL
jgi:hypothetical protein